MLICIEGIDGSGKSTQAKKLATTLTSRGLDVATMRFPRYEETEGGQLVGDFLDGKFGEILADLHPKLTALPYMIDRFESRERLFAQLAVRDVVVIDRFVASNVAHQAAKLMEETDRAEFIIWVKNMEFGVFGLPRPDLTFEFVLPADKAYHLIAKKKQRSYTDEQFDLHEADRDYQRQVADVYQQASRTGMFSSEWRMVDVMRNGHFRDVDDIASEVFVRAKETLSNQGVSLDG